MPKSEHKALQERMKFIDVPQAKETRQCKAWHPLLRADNICTVQYPLHVKCTTICATHTTCRLKQLNHMHHKGKKSRGVCETLTMPPAATKSKKAIFSAKVKVKVTKSLTLISFERASLVEYACQIGSLYL